MEDGETHFRRKVLRSYVRVLFATTSNCGGNLSLWACRDIIPSLRRSVVENKLIFSPKNFVAHDHICTGIYCAPLDQHRGGTETLEVKVFSFDSSSTSALKTSAPSSPPTMHGACSPPTTYMHGAGRHVLLVVLLLDEDRRK